MDWMGLFAMSESIKAGLRRNQMCGFDQYMKEMGITQESIDRYQQKRLERITAFLGYTFIALFGGFIIMFILMGILG